RMPTWSSVALTRPNCCLRSGSCSKEGPSVASPRMLNVLVADDSTVSRQLLVHIVSNAPDMCVVGEAVTGRQAVKLACELRPDIILMDMMMPDLNGLEAIREIMHLQPVPIVAVSAQIEAAENDLALQAIKAGALTAIPKPAGPRHASFQSDSALFVNTL